MAYNDPKLTVVIDGDASKARRALGWTPRVDFAEMVARMVRAER